MLLYNFSYYGEGRCCCKETVADIGPYKEVLLIDSSESPNLWNVDSFSRGKGHLLPNLICLTLPGGGNGLAHFVAERITVAR